MNISYYKVNLKLGKYVGSQNDTVNEYWVDLGVFTSFWEPTSILLYSTIKRQYVFQLFAFRYYKQKKCKV